MYRTIDCDTWDDPWFAERSRDAKLLFLYFITNRRTSAAGCLEITNRVIEFDTGMDGDAIAGAMTDLGDRVVWWPSLNVVFVRNFFKHQRRNSNRENFRKAAAASLEDVPELVRRTVWDAYPELEETTHTQPIPNPSVRDDPIPNPSLSHGYKETETETEQSESRAKKTRATATPNEYTPNETQYAWALDELGFDTLRVDRETEKFLDYHRSRGSTLKDWAAAWRNWMRRVTDYAPKGKGGAPTQSVDGKPYWDGTQYRRADGLVV